MRRKEHPEDAYGGQGLGAVKGKEAAKEMSRDFNK